MYTDINFKTKKALKEAVAAWNAYQEAKKELPVLSIGSVMLAKTPEPRAITFYQPGPFAGNEPKNGKIFLEGPHYPAAHSWYAEAEVKDGVVIKVK
jgi:hypothetical protein